MNTRGIFAQPAISWRDLPNPLNIPTIREQLQHIAPPLSGKRPGGGGKNRLTIPVGRDGLGVGFEVGDTVLLGQRYRPIIAEVEGIYTEDSSGNRYYEPQDLLYSDAKGNDLFVYRYSYGAPNNRIFSRVDPEWRGVRIGLITEDLQRYLPAPGFRRSASSIALKAIDDGFLPVAFQGIKVKIKLLHDGRSKFVGQDQLTVLGDHLTDGSLLQAYQEALQPPLV